MCVVICFRPRSLIWEEWWIMIHLLSYLCTKSEGDSSCNSVSVHGVNLLGLQKSDCQEGFCIGRRRPVRYHYNVGSLWTSPSCSGQRACVRRVPACPHLSSECSPSSAQAYLSASSWNFLSSQKMISLLFSQQIRCVGHGPLPISRRSDGLPTQCCRCLGDGIAKLLGE